MGEKVWTWTKVVLLALLIAGVVALVVAPGALWVFWAYVQSYWQGEDGAKTRSTIGEWVDKAREAK